MKRTIAVSFFVLLISGIVPVFGGDLSGALDTTLSFTTGGDADWFDQSAVSYYDSDAVQSGEITDNQRSWIKTVLNGPTTLSFYWRVSSETYLDNLGFYVDGQRYDRISGSMDWQQKTYDLGPGSHELEWRYFKDDSVSNGSDCGWIDKIEWGGGGSEPPPPPPPGNLSEALDTTLGIITGGNAGWFAQSSTFYNDSDAAQSGSISHNQVSWMRTTVDGDTTASFYWKVSSESGYDFLEFYVDGERQDRISDHIDWHQVSYELGSGSHELEWRYFKDGSVTAGGDCGWVDQFELGSGGSEPPDPNDPNEPPPTGDLSDALDTDLNFATGGDADWFGQSETTFYDSDAAESGNISDNEETWMQTVATGEGTLSFFWKVSSESYLDYLEFYINGELQHRISGSVDWQHRAYTLNSGTHTLKWRYIKDYSVSSGYDRGWVDQLEWGGGGSDPPDPPTNDLSEALDTEYGFNTGGSADWLAQSTVFYYDGDAAKSGDISDNQVSWMQTSVGEEGTISFYWKVSSEANYDYLEFYIDGDFKDQISGSVDWQHKEYALNPGSHTLEWRYVKDGSNTVGSDCGWVDKVELGESPDPNEPPTGDLSEALDTTFDFTTGGSAGWFSQSSIFVHGGDAGESGSINDSQESWLRTMVGGPTPISFYWRVSSEAFFDFLEFSIDGVFQDKISGSPGWQQMTYNIGQGAHELKWRYYKDGSMSTGNDCGWVDKLELSSGSEPPDPNEPDPNEPEPPDPSDELSEALDTSLALITEGDAEWFNQSAMFYFDGDAAQSGDITHRQESIMETTVDGPGTVRFYWKVSSEGDYDYLKFYIDGEVQDEISGTIDWQQKVYYCDSGLQTLQWRYVKDRSMSYFGDCGWVDKLEWESGGSGPPPQENLSHAMDTTLLFTTGGDEDWFAQNTTFYYDSDAAQSGDISYSQESWLRTTIIGPNEVSFYWKVSSESGHDYLKFFIDDELQDQISGSVGWQQQTYTVGHGSYYLEWRYIKDETTTVGNDCGWVDKVEYLGGEEPPPPPPTDDLSEAMDTTLSFTVGGDAYWFAQSIMFYNDFDAAQSGEIDHAQESWMQTTVDGPNTVSYYWKVSSEGGYDYLEFYIDGERQQRISGAPGWEQVTYDLEEGPHTLEWRYAKDLGNVSGNDCGWVDMLEVGSGSEPPDPNDPNDPNPPSTELSGALDTDLSFSVGGSAPWYGQSGTFYYGGDAARSGAIWHNQESFMETTVNGPTTVIFYWKVSSEASYDYLGFYVDGTIQSQISSELDWERFEHTIPGGPHTLRWRYLKDGSINLGNDCGWVDKVELGSGSGTPGEQVPLSEAMDTTLTFTTGGNAAWFGQTDTSYSAGDAAQSGDISDLGVTWLRTTKLGGETISFFWKISSEGGYDYMEFYIDGELQDQTSGERDWQPRVYTLPWEWQTYTLEWRYIKDGSGSVGADCGWVDFVK